MRVFLATAVLAGGVLLGYAMAPRSVSAQTQFNQAGITAGERIRLWLDPDRTAYDCTVIDVRGDFVGCKASDTAFASPRPDRWYNLRLVVRIERPGTRD